MHRDDVPAALPLIALVAGLLAREGVYAFAAIALLLMLIKRFRLATLALALAAGAWVAGHQTDVAKRERLAFDALEASRFIRIEAPLDHDWSRKRDAYALRVRRFRANGQQFEEPLGLYARFQPPPILLHATVTVEGFLHRNEKGGWMVSVKSPRLLAYHGTLSPLDPARWNRSAAMRLDRYADRYPDEVALTEALALGRGERLTEATRDNFKRGGTYHLLVFSGLQIALAAAVIAALLRWLHAPRASDWSLLMFAIMAPLFIGPTASVWRASMCIGLFAVSRIAKRPTSIANLWCVSAMIRLLVAPSDLADAAFQLTYAGAGALLFAGRPLASRRARWVAYAIAAEVTITPLTLFHFHQYAIGGSITTMLITPLVFAMLVVASLACAFPCAALLSTLGVVDRLCLRINAFSAIASGVFAAPALAAMVAGFAGAMLAVAFLRGRVRAVTVLGGAAVPLIAALLFDDHSRSVAIPQLVALDVGQGDALLLRSGAHNLLVDGGPDDSILPLLVDRGVRRLDVVLLSHAHPDHCGGLVDVVERMTVGSLWLSPRRFSGDCATRLLEAARLRGTPIHLVRPRDSQTVGAIRFDTLMAERVPRHSPENNSSIVMRVQIERTRLVLTGDIEREAELDLLPDMRHADVVKIAHHGSHTSSAPWFLAALSPRLALISCGNHNLFGHPHPEVVAGLRQRRILLKRTDRMGTVVVQMDGRQLRTTSEIDTPR
ncbi:MAG: DNA internalization-related competence protein ComEC/Rec2 [Acidobacteriota bacterium]